VREQCFGLVNEFTKKRKHEKFHYLDMTRRPRETFRLSLLVTVVG